MIYVKTEMGQTAFQNRNLALLPRQRSAFILFDGKRRLDEVLKATAGLGVTQDDVEHMLALGLLAPHANPDYVPSAPAPLTGMQPVPTGRSGVVEAASMSMPAPLAPTPFVPSQPAVDAPPTPRAQANYSRAYPIATRLTAGLGLRGFRLNLAVEAAGDLEKLRDLAPRIREAVGAEKFRELEDALYGS